MRKYAKKKASHWWKRAMQTLFFTFAVVALLMLAMSVGVIMTGRRLRGSCGGVGSDCACEKEGIPRAQDCPLRKIAEEQAV